ncbi:hypothetical protein BGZ76_001671 [Entomortierella beljakovae]|nr:hypothetical protein BGZ76_001671 [Entomortierella beljakovae]
MAHDLMQMNMDKKHVLAKMNQMEDDDNADEDDEELANVEVLLAKEDEDVDNDDDDPVIIEFMLPFIPEEAVIESTNCKWVLLRYVETVEDVEALGEGGGVSPSLSLSSSSSFVFLGEVAAEAAATTAKADAEATTGGDCDREARRVCRARSLGRGDQ